MIKLCKDCKYFIADYEDGQYINVDESECSYPDHQETCLITGDTKYPTCDFMRNSDESILCGAEGALFVARPEKNKRRK